MHNYIDDGIIGVVSWDSAKGMIIESGYCTCELQGVGYSVGYECYLILVLAWQVWPVLVVAAMLRYNNNKYSYLLWGYKLVSMIPVASDLIDHCSCQCHE